MLDRSHDPERRSWLPSANRAGADFPIQNLPYGVFSAGNSRRRVGVAIGDMILDLTGLEAEKRLMPGRHQPVFETGTMNAFMALPVEAWSRTRAAIADLLDAVNGPGDLERFLVAQRDARLHLPIFVRSFTDFYASREHATHVGAMFRGQANALMPNWLHIPIGYNGRASSVVVSGTAIHRPRGQIKGPSDTAPRFAPTARLDLELELGAIVGTPSVMGQLVTTEEAYAMIFGYVLLNDWSARDIQLWEYQPLGPFQSKAFATSISPWIVTREALEPFRHPTPERLMPLLPYLAETAPNNLDIHLEADLAPGGAEPTRLCATNTRLLYYSPAQQLAHHASSGCPMCTGDLLGSGTISGSAAGSQGSLLELTANGREPVEVAGGTRSFIEDGDTITLRGWCEGRYRIGFGRCEGTILEALPLEH